MGQPARSDDNINPERPHWHSAPPVATYRLHTSLNAAMRNAIGVGGSAWPSYTKFSLTRGADISGAVDYNNSSTHLVFTAALPRYWTEICPNTGTIACTRARTTIAYVTNPPHLFIYDADTIFDATDTFTTTACTQSTTPPYNAQTIALHEFGHWGYLNDLTTDQNARMYGAYLGCRGYTNVHDRNSMFHNYEGAGH